MFPTCAGVLIVEAIFNNFWDILMFILRLDTENDSTFQHASKEAEENKSELPLCSLLSTRALTSEMYLKKQSQQPV